MLRKSKPRIIQEKPCKHCTTPFKRWRTTDKFCSQSCMDKYKRLNPTKQSALDKKKAAFQAMVRLRDEGLPCISCGATESFPCWHAGHYLKVEVYPGLAFNEDNCHKQCFNCNINLHGNQKLYRLGLIERIGESKVLELERIKNTNRVQKVGFQIATTI